jgi:tRNA(fMet)-specific endonuclease VapC
VKYLFDTDHLSVLQQQSEPDYSALLRRIVSHPQTDLNLCVISFHEQILGCHTYVSRARTAANVVRGYSMLSRLLDDYASAVVLPFCPAAAVEFDKLLSFRIRIGTMDLRIASIALARKLILVTRNTSDFS